MDPKTFDSRQSPLDPSSELRFLGAGERRKLVEMLDAAESWRELATVIKKSNGEFLVTSKILKILEDQKYSFNKSPSQILLDYWATTGRKHERPTLNDLLETLKSCCLLRAANYVSNEILKLDDGTSSYDTTDDLSECDVQKLKLEDEFSSPADPSAPSASLMIPDLDSHVEHQDIERFSYHDLRRWTDNFSDVSVTESGQKIGEGAFGSVFKAITPDGRNIAIKVLKDDYGKQFLNEVNVMCRVRHENLLPLMGISTDGSKLCMIMQFMERGSLSKVLSDNSITLIPDERLKIAVGTASGLSHLHTFFEKPYVHRDVKSDNILLDSDLTPKLADFGLARIGSSGASGLITSRHHMTQNVIGTSVYMAPEAFRGDVSVKLDTFAYGVVLLELLTGLKPYDESREEPDILSHIEEWMESIEDLESKDGEERLQKILDQRTGDNWNLKMAKELFVISRMATEQRKKNRPQMTEVLILLQKIIT